MPHTSKRWYLATIAMVLAAALPASSSRDREDRLVRINRAHLCVTKGAIKKEEGSLLAVEVPEMRAVVAYPTRAVAEAEFTYLGPTRKDKPLHSGEIRRQFGLKLRAQNGCNLVYAMWRIKPKEELVVSVKLNPGKTTSAECDANGYHTIKPTHDLNPPRLVAGEKHTLRAEIEGSEMKVSIDGKLTWEGLLDREALALEGPSGVRSDNGRFRFKFLSSEPVAGGKIPPCHADDEE
jgi:hypothetical protein